MCVGVCSLVERSVRGKPATVGVTGRPTLIDTASAAVRVTAASSVGISGSTSSIVSTRRGNTGVSSASARSV